VVADFVSLLPDLDNFSEGDEAAGRSDPATVCELPLARFPKLYARSCSLADALLDGALRRIRQLALELASRRDLAANYLYL